MGGAFVAASSAASSSVTRVRSREYRGEEGEGSSAVLGELSRRREDNKAGLGCRVDKTIFLVNVDEVLAAALLLNERGVMLCVS